MLGITRLAPTESSVQIGQANGQPALFIYVAEQLFGVMTMDVGNGRSQHHAFPEKFNQISFPVTKRPSPPSTVI